MSADFKSIIIRTSIAIALLLALAPWPYVYYTLLRVVVFFVFGYYAIQYWQTCEKNKRRTPWWVWGLAATALLFNPFIPAHLTREIWSVFNFTAALLLLGSIRWERSLFEAGNIRSDSLDDKPRKSASP